MTYPINITTRHVVECVCTDPECNFRETAGPGTPTERTHAAEHAMITGHTVTEHDVHDRTVRPVLIDA